LAPLQADLGLLSKFLTHQVEPPSGMIWIGPKGAFTPLHHDLTNNFIAQVVGRKHIKLLPANEVGRLFNQTDVFSEITDLDDPCLDLQTYPRLNGARVYDIVLEPGEILFAPLAWWHQVRALDFSVTLTYTNFLWPNDAHLGFPVV
jgi:ribosomal protein L16 Arg81 hydroxylase